MTLRSVGTTTEGGAKCRWIEMHMDGKRDGMKEGGVFKLLFKESDFAGVKKAPKIMRGWVQNKIDGEIKELGEDEKDAHGMIGIFFGGNGKTRKPLKTERVIDYQKGQLKIAKGTKESLDVKPPGPAPEGLKFNATQSVWKHKSMPFGTAAMTIEMEISVKDVLSTRMTMKFTVKDHGTGGKNAKSALPEKK